MFNGEPLLMRNDIRRILLLGHTGFIGRNLLRRFREFFPTLEVIGCSLPEHDLTSEKDVRALAELFDLNTAVLLCSAIKRQYGDTLEVFLKNQEMVVNLCRLMCTHPVRRFVYFSSTAVYGEETKNMRITESTPVNPTSFYGIAKYVSECLLRREMFERKESSLLILRPPTIYGPEDRAGHYGPSGFVRAAIRGDKITLWGDGSELREFIFIDDLAKIVCGLTLHEFSGVINIASGRSYTFVDVVAAVSKVAACALTVDSRPRSKAKADVAISNLLLRELFPAVIFTSLEEGIRRTFEAEQKLSNAILNRHEIA
jgi:UDP-glucose 4-epimerase